MMSLLNALQELKSVYFNKLLLVELGLAIENSYKFMRQISSCKEVFDSQ